MATHDASKLLPKPINIRDYELSKTIGIGSYSIVKLGLGEHVRNEIKCLSAAESIFIEKYQGFALDDKYIYIATELVLGGDLATHLRKEIKLSVPQAQ